MKNFLIYIVFLFFPVQSYACICGELAPLKDYEYIALVEIVDIRGSSLLKTLSDLHLSNTKERISPPVLPFYEVEVRTVHQYKGDNRKIILVFGGNERLGNAGSCDLDLSIGDKWIFTGYPYYFGSEIMTGYCTQSRRLENGFGERDYHYARSLKLLDTLNTHYGIYDDKPENGIYREFFPNGELRLEEQRKNGLLTGQRTAFYVNGKMMLLECWENGLREEECIWWNKNGSLRKECYYQKGKLFGDLIHYDRNGNPTVLHHYSENGDFLYTKNKNL
jgi:hypothetical protein